jgi:protein-S-isoprenylcysteine O-methyltransferase Ste14
MSAKMALQAAVLTLAAVGQIVLAFVLYNENGSSAVRNVGWIILWISALFGWLPIFNFRKWGQVPKGKSYVHTTVVVDRGLYAIVRHPQYLAGILMGIGLGLIAQNWIVVVLGFVVAIISYIGTTEEEAGCLEKFGEAYAQYMERVPGVNFVLGIYRWVKVQFGSL